MIVLHLLLSKCHVGLLREGFKIKLRRHWPLLLSEAWKDLLGASSLANLGIFLRNLGLKVPVRRFNRLLLGFQLHGFSYARYPRTLCGLAGRQACIEAIRILNHIGHLLWLLRLRLNIVLREDLVLRGDMA